MNVRTLAAAAALAAVALTAGAATAEAQVGKPVTIVDVNLVPEKDLATLPHVTPAIAKAIMDKRPFQAATDLDALLTQQGLSKEQRTELYGKAFVHVNLNTASREEILLIPGTGNRMLREFLEYRPYKNLAQFHREIDKYVDDAELARLEQYVFVPIELNTATDADILTIPGSGNRMLREFKEYRPYKTMDQFRREMRKYWDAKEVARLERFVTIAQ